MKINSGYWKGWEAVVRVKCLACPPPLNVGDVEGKEAEDIFGAVYIVDKFSHRLPEHDVKFTDGGYGLHLEIKHGQEFQIVVSRSVKHSIRYQIDGRNIHGIGFASDCQVDTAFQAHSFELHRGQVYRKTLKFAELRRTENGPEIDVKATDKLGTIRVTLEGGTFAANSYVTAMTPAHDQAHEEVSEKVKKGRMASVTGGDFIQPVSRVFQRDFIPDSSIPKINVIFTYATREALMADDVIPNMESNFETLPTPSKTPKPTIKQIDRKPFTRARSGSSTDDDSDDIVVINEAPAKKKRKIHTVDLTDDKKPPIFVNLADDSDDEASADKNAKKPGLKFMKSKTTVKAEPSQCQKS